MGAGADVIELGVPYSDPLADGPVIHAAGTRALAAGANIAGVLEVARALAQSVPVVLMCYANMVFAPGAEAFVERLAKTGACGLIVPDLPLGEGPEVRAGVRCARPRAGAAGRAHDDAGAHGGDRGAARAGFLYTVSVVGTTGERAGAGRALRARSSRARRRARAAPVALGFGIGTPEQALQAARRGRGRRDRRHQAGARGGRGRGSGGRRRGGRGRTGCGPRVPRLARIPPRMGLILTVTAGLVVWVVLWALGAKGFDAFMLATVDHPGRGLAEDPRGLPSRSPQLAAGARALLALGRDRRRSSAVLAVLVALPVALAGCGGVGVSGAADADRQPADDLLEPAAAGAVGRRSPSRSSTARSSRCARRAAAIGPFKISYVSMDDSNPKSGEWDPGDHRRERQDGRRGHDHDRLPRRLQLGRHAPCRCR